MKEITAALDKQYEYLDEKQRFLLEVKIDHVLEEHPQWVEEIYADLENFKYVICTRAVLLTNRLASNTLQTVLRSPKNKRLLLENNKTTTVLRHFHLSSILPETLSLMTVHW